MYKLSTRVVAIILSLLSLISLCSCGFEKDEFAIDNHVWSFKYAQNSDGEIVYCNAENKALYENAEILDLWSSAKGGVFMISNNDTQETFAFSYVDRRNSVEYLYYQMVYNIVEGGIGCYGIVGKTVDESGKGEYTLVITVGGYSIYFYEAIEQ